MEEQIDCHCLLVLVLLIVVAIVVSKGSARSHCHHCQYYPVRIPFKHTEIMGGNIESMMNMRMPQNGGVSGAALAVVGATYRGCSAIRWQTRILLVYRKAP